MVKFTGIEEIGPGVLVALVTDRPSHLLDELVYRVWLAEQGNVWCNADDVAHSLTTYIEREWTNYCAAEARREKIATAKGPAYR